MVCNSMKSMVLRLELLKCQVRQTRQLHMTHIQKLCLELNSSHSGLAMFQNINVNRNSFSFEHHMPLF